MNYVANISILKRKCTCKVMYKKRGYFKNNFRTFLAKYQLNDFCLREKHIKNSALHYGV